MSHPFRKEMIAVAPFEVITLMISFGLLVATIMNGREQ